MFMICVSIMDGHAMANIYIVGNHAPENLRRGSLRPSRTRNNDIKDTPLLGGARMSPITFFLPSATALHIGWAIMTRPPPRHSVDPRTDCTGVASGAGFAQANVSQIMSSIDAAPAVLGSGSHHLLACAFATWLPTLRAPNSSVAILFDCGKDPLLYNVTPSARSTSDVPKALEPPTWTHTVSEGVHVSHGCLWGGVCVTKTKTTKFCVRGTVGLFYFAVNSLPADVDMIAKVDTDAFVLPDLVFHALSSHVKRLPAGCCHGATDGSQRRLYYGNLGRTVNMLMDTRAEDRTHKKRLRSTQGWIDLEREIGGWDISPSARQARSMAVGYAAGAFYVVSRAAAEHAVRHNCHERVSQVACSGWGGEGDRQACEWNVGHEDLDTGLCMHLADAATFTSSCVDVSSRHHCFPTLISHPYKEPQHYWHAYQRAIGSLYESAPHVRTHIGSSTKSQAGFGPPPRQLVRSVQEALNRSLWTNFSSYIMDRNTHQAHLEAQHHADRAAKHKLLRNASNINASAAEMATRD